MKKVFYTVSLSVLFLSCQNEEFIKNQDVNNLEQKEVLASTSQEPQSSFSSRIKLPRPNPPFYAEGLYIGEDHAIAAVNTSTGSGYFYNPDQPSNIAMASTGGFVYSLITDDQRFSSGTLYKINVTGVSDNHWTNLGVWPNTRVMAAYGNYLYVVQETTLYRINANDGSSAPFSNYPTGWDGTSAMTAIDNHLYAIHAGTLYRVNLTNGSVTNFSAYPDGWEGTGAMAATNGAVFVVQGGTLWKVTISNGSVAPFSAYPTGWEGTRAMTAKDGYLYAVQGNALWKVNTFNGNVAKLGNISWTGVTAMTARQ
jgi:hypothetical protein